MQARTARDRLDRILSIVGRAGRFWAPAMILVVLGTFASLAFAYTRERVYKSETLMLYREGIRSSELGEASSGSDPARKLGLKLKEMVLSRTRLQQIIDEYKLYPDIIEDRGYVDAVDEMRAHIAFRVKDGDTFGLSFEGNNAERVQAITARLAEALIGENSKRRAEQAEVTKEFIDAERSRSEEELKDKESSLSKFLSKHPEFVRESQNTGAAASALRANQQQKGAKPVDPNLLALEREANRLQERLGMPVTKPTPKKSEPASDPVLLAAKNEAEADLHAAQRELSDKLNQFTEQHPDVRAAKSKVKAAELKLKRALDALVAGNAALQQRGAEPLEEEATIDRATLENQLKKLNEEIAASKRKKVQKEEAKPDENAVGGAAWIVALETEWSQLNRDVQEARARNTQLQEKQFRASMAENAATSGRNAQMVIVDPAYRPTHPSKPSRTLIAASGIIATLFLAFALALGCALLDDRLYDRVDVERLEIGPLLAVVPKPPAHRGRRRAQRV
jgi:hypothetical protein